MQRKRVNSDQIPFLHETIDDLTINTRSRSLSFDELLIESNSDEIELFDEIYENINSSPIDVTPTPFKNQIDEFSRLIHSSSKDFSSIDWQTERRNERYRMKKSSVFLGYFYKLRPWIIIVFVAVSAAFLNSVIVVFSNFLNSIRFGVCDSFFLPKTLCCYQQEDCSQYNTWFEVFEPMYGSEKAVFFERSLYYATGIIYPFIAAILVHTMSKYSKGSGIPETKAILSGVSIRSFLGFFTLLIKFLTMPLVVAAGLALGQEGPMVHIAACLGNLFCRLFKIKSEATKRDILSYATGTGVSVSFGGAIIGGAIFAIEETSFYFSQITLWRTFFGTAIAALSLKIFNPTKLSPTFSLQADIFHSFSPVEIPFFILLGLFTGLLSVLFIKFNTWIAKSRKKYHWWKNSPILEVLVVAIITAIVCDFFPLIRESYHHMLEVIFSDCGSRIGDVDLDFICRSDISSQIMWYLVKCGVASFFLCGMVFGTGIPAGIFIPSLVIGGSFGRAFALLLQNVFKEYPHFCLFSNCVDHTQCISPSVYALIGAMGFLTGTTRLQLAIVIVVIEYCGAVKLIIPLVFVSITAKSIADVFSKHSLYEEYIVINGYPFLSNEGRDLFGEIASGIMCQEPIVFHRKETLSSIMKTLQEHKVNGFPIIDKEDSKLIGYIDRSAVISALSDASISFLSPSTQISFDIESKNFGDKLSLSLQNWRHLIDESPICVVKSTPISRIFTLIRQLGLHTVLVTNQGKLKGLITRGDLIRFHQQSEIPDKDK
eukprot:TRINITY_DN2257_c0_g1_i1.p1 TRINITY_DN2257_c0_g1~~TRINITY_DN2257_c0_g1_i1.p1  ORF type:complete len:769 (+),score=167.95 TRINITY_DN2257_c0_g1_i1:446-2752(+)